MRRLPGGLRLRLTVSYLLILLFALAAVGVFQYFALQNFLYREVATRVVDEGYSSFKNRPFPTDPQAVVRIASSAVTSAALYDASGVEATSRSEATVNDPGWVKPALTSNPPTGDSGSTDFQVLRAQKGRVLAVVLPATCSRRPCYLVLETSLTPTDQTLRSELTIFGVAAAFTLFGAGLAGSFIIGRILKRLELMSQTATAIAAGDISRRARIGGNDEVAALGAAFDEMVGRLEQEIVRQQESEQAMRRFVGDASHELRTPLTALRGNLDILRRGAVRNSIQYKTSLTDMHTTTLRMGRLVDDLLTLTRLEGGGELELVATDADQALAEAARTARYTAEQHVISVEKAPGVFVTADPDALQRVLVNLVENAAKYSPAGTSIKLRAAPDGNGQVSIEVEDQGPGISPEEQGRIFDRFYRGDKARSAGGLGLGLSICTALVRRQGGDLTVRSRVGSGSVFSVVLPAATPAG